MRTEMIKGKRVAIIESTTLFLKDTTITMLKRMKQSNDETYDDLIKRIYKQIMR